MEDQKKEVLEILEKNLATCKVCGKIKQRNLAGRWHGKDKKYVDELGLYYNGKTCGLCNLERVRTQMAKMREKRKQEALLAKLETKKEE
jgi:hypothetical protein